MLHVAASMAPLPLTLALAGRQVTAVLAALSGVALAAVAVLLARQRRGCQHAAAEASATAHVEQALQEVYDEWITEQAWRGEGDLDRWRRTYRL